MVAYVVDASAAVEYLLRTPVGLSLAGVLDEADVHAPELIDVEVLSALRRGVLRHGLSAERAGAAVADLLNWPLQRIPHRLLGAAAWELRHNFSAYDACYLAAASASGSSPPMDRWHGHPAPASRSTTCRSASLLGEAFFLW